MYCLKCGKESKTQSGNCSHCGEPLVTEELSHNQRRELSQALHNRLNKARENFDGGMVGIVLGATLLTIGIIFFVLSFKVPDDPDIVGKVLRTSCFEFWVSMAGFVIGGVLFVIGAIRVILNKFIREREILNALDAVQDGTYDHLAVKSIHK